MGRKSKDPQHIRRPLNCFFLFRCAKIKELSQLQEGPQSNLGRKISHMWREASPEEKAIYIAKALEAQEQHKKMYPDYHYRPQKKKGKNMAVTKSKTEAAKAKVPGSPSSSASYSSLTSSPASYPSPTTPDTTAVPMLASGSYSSGGAFGSNFGQDFVFNHNQPVASGIHEIEQPYSVQYDGHLRPSKIVGWTDQPQLPSTSTGDMHRENDTPSLPPKSVETVQGLFANPYYQPQVAHALHQAFNFSPTVEEGLQLPTGGMNQQAPQPPPQQAVSQMLPPLQAHAAAPQPETEPSSSGAYSTELEAWNKEFAPLDAGFCDLLAAWTNLREASASSASDSSAPSSTSGATQASPSLPPTATHHLDIADDHTQGLPSQTQDPLALSFDPASFDPSLMLMFYDPLQTLPPTAVWPEALDPFDI